ncbi:hypothetical protein DWB77_04780 [Streptomyces hundungensis]|uniref:Uncharacterized protein n=1 Tax=Streptomyces hundungensis TaxID=1077946 RepID=A0A387HGI7_9ACTN|nr:hypothetical protein [Streptomyces hundungensis]AYG82599.1 hypothetical protein DWB77_04780 [Streptomyces hundungensis]
MPRPTAAQLSYGSATVVFSTVAMLLLSRTESGVGVAVIVLAALLLGLLVAVTVPMPLARRTRADAHANADGRTVPAAGAAPVNRAAVVETSAAGAAASPSGQWGSVPAPRERRASTRQHSLRS